VLPLCNENKHDDDSESEERAERAAQGDGQWVRSRCAEHAGWDVPVWRHVCDDAHAYVIVGVLVQLCYIVDVRRRIEQATLLGDGTTESLVVYLEPMDVDGCHLLLYTLL